VPTVSLRYFNVYGPGQDPASEYAAVIPRFTMACLTGATPVEQRHGEAAEKRHAARLERVRRLRESLATEAAW